MRIGLGTSLLILLLFIVSPFDLPVAKAITDQNNSLGRYIQDYGTLPQGVLIVASVVILSIARFRRAFPLIARASSALIAHSLLHPLLFCTTLKFIWRRTRPAEVLERGIEFAPFYLPNPTGHGVSFPSGHVAASLVLLPVVFLLIQTGKTKAAIATIIVTVFWVIAVSFGRMLYGAHFLTDIIFSVGTAILFVSLSIKIGDWYLTKYESKKCGASLTSE